MHCGDLTTTVNKHVIGSYPIYGSIQEPLVGFASPGHQCPPPDSAWRYVHTPYSYNTMDPMLRQKEASRPAPSVGAGEWTPEGTSGGDGR